MSGGECYFVRSQKGRVIWGQIKPSLLFRRGIHCIVLSLENLEKEDEAEKFLTEKFYGELREKQQFSWHIQLSRLRILTLVPTWNVQTAQRTAEMNALDWIWDDEHAKTLFPQCRLSGKKWVLTFCKDPSIPSQDIYPVC